jgi:hypothetical protein
MRSIIIIPKKLILTHQNCVIRSHGFNKHFIIMGDQSIKYNSNINDSVKMNRRSFSIMQLQIHFS